MSLGDPIDLPADGPTSVASVAAIGVIGRASSIVDLLSSGRRLGYAAVDHRVTSAVPRLRRAPAQSRPERPHPDRRTVRAARLCDLPQRGTARASDQLESAERRTADRQPARERVVALRQSAVAARDDTDRPAQQLAVRQPVVDRRHRRRDVLDRRGVADAEPLQASRGSTRTGRRQRPAVRRAAPHRRDAAAQPAAAGARAASRGTRHRPLLAGG